MSSENDGAPVSIPKETVIASYNLIEKNGQLELKEVNAGDSTVNILADGQDINVRNIMKNVSFEFAPTPKVNDEKNVVPQIAGPSNKIEENVEADGENEEKTEKDLTFKMDLCNVKDEKAKMLVESLNNFSSNVQKYVKDLPTSYYVSDSPQKVQLWKIIQSVIVDKKLYHSVLKKKERKVTPDALPKINKRKKRTKK